MSDTGTLATGWVKTSFGNIIELIGGGTPKTTEDEYWNGSIPWLSIVDFNNDSRWVYKTEKSITEEGLNNSSTKLLQDGDLIISARGTVGVIAQMKIQMAFNQSCYGIRAKEDLSNIDFLYYLLKYSIKQFLRNTHGAVFDTITRQTFDNIFILLPQLDEQKAIAEVLSCYDNKIELLQNQNKTLEEIAQTLFKEWFVDYRFPGVGKMVESELGMIPEGWRVGALHDEFSVTMGQSPKGESYNVVKDGMIFFQGRAEFSERFPTIRLYTTQPKRIAKKFNVLVSVRAPVGDINVAFDECCIGRGLAAVGSNYKSYCLYKIKSLSVVFNGFESEGTVFGSINKASFENIKVVLPKPELVELFEETVAPIDRKIFHNYKQIQTLTELRDKLLPKLMSGVVRVNI